MEIKVGVAKTKKYAVTDCGDSMEVAERPRGGISAILADGQGSGKAAKITSSLVVNKAASLIAEGARDGAVARAVHDYLYVIKDGKVSSTLTVLSVDLDTQSVLFSRNSNCPVILKHAYGIQVYDEDVSSIGVHKRMKPLMYEFPLETGLIMVSYTDGIQSAGRKRGKELNFEFIKRIIEENAPDDAPYIAEAILEYALGLDEERPSDDMTVVVIGICDTESLHNIRRMSISFPC